MVRRLGLGKNNHLTYASLALNPRCAPSKDSDQPAHQCSLMCSLIRVFAGLCVDSQGSKTSSGSYQTVWMWLLISVFAGHKCILAGNTAPWLIYYHYKTIFCTSGRIKRDFRGFSPTPLWLKISFHGKFWINLINLRHFSIYMYFSSTSVFYYLWMCVKLLGE